MNAKKVKVITKMYFQYSNGFLSEPYDWIGEPFLGFRPFEKNRRLGVATMEGKVIVSPICDPMIHINGTVWLGNGTYFRLSKRHKFGLIRVTDGSIVIPFKWDNINLIFLSEDLVPVCKKEKWGFFDLTKKTLIAEPIYDAVYPFKNGYAVVHKDGKLGIINAKGVEILPTEYSSVIEFLGHFAIARDDFISPGKSKIIDTNGIIRYETCNKIFRKKNTTATFIETDFYGKNIKTFRLRFK